MSSLLSKSFHTINVFRNLVASRNPPASSRPSSSPSSGSRWRTSGRNFKAEIGIKIWGGSGFRQTTSTRESSSPSLDGEVRRSGARQTFVSVQTSFLRSLFRQTQFAPSVKVIFSFILFVYKSSILLGRLLRKIGETLTSWKMLVCF
jgi:hypothetical protein